MLEDSLQSNNNCYNYKQQCIYHTSVIYDNGERLNDGRSSVRALGLSKGDDTPLSQTWMKYH